MEEKIDPFELTNCIFTGLPVSEVGGKTLDFYSYDIQAGLDIRIKIHKPCFQSIYRLPLKRRYHLGGMILRGEIKLNYDSEFHLDKSSLHDDRRIEVIPLTESIVDFSADEKLDSLLVSLANAQTHEGSRIELELNPGHKLFVINRILPNEGLFYLGSLTHAHFIDINHEEAQDGFDIWSVTFTMDGIRRVQKLKSGGVESKNCFVAMSFKNETVEIRKTIKAALVSLGYNPVLIDETHVERESTINDAIIAAIKQCKFCISDFTFQSFGVYFESGYALGIGRKVIYTCRSDWFEGKSHFDTNHFPHIVYNNVDDLAVKLKNKIEAWIK